MSYQKDEITEMVSKENDQYVVMDTTEIIQKSNFLLQHVFSRAQQQEIIRQIFESLRPDTNVFFQAVLSLPNYSFIRGNFSTLNQEDKVSIQDAILELSFQIYMSARENGLFIGSEGPNAFPFYLEKLNDFSAFFMLDKVAARRHQQITQG